MKILFIALKYDYGNLKRGGYSFEYHNFYEPLRRMENGKHEIIYFPFDEIINKMGIDGMNQAILEEVKKQEPDLCFFCLFRDEFRKETIAEISKKYKTFNWFFDDSWRFRNFSKDWCKYFHYISTTDAESVKKYHDIGYKNVIETQYACNHHSYQPRSIEKKYDVTFIGQSHSNRKKLTKFVQKNEIKIQCWGKGWPNGKIGQKKMIEIFGESRINLNFSQGSASLLKKFAKIFLRKNITGKWKLNSPALWKSHFLDFCENERMQIKGRIFEIGACRSFLLTEYAENLKKFYQEGKEIAVFKNKIDLTEKIRYYLEHKKERNRMAGAYYRRTLKEHTYEKRFKEIFKKMGLA